MKLEALESGVGGVLLRTEDPLQVRFRDLHIQLSFQFQATHIQLFDYKKVENFAVPDSAGVRFQALPVAHHSRAAMLFKSCQLNVAGVTIFC